MTHPMSNSQLAKYLADEKATVKKSNDGKQIVWSTPRPIGTHWVFSSVGDDPTEEDTVWGGGEIKHHHEISDDMTQTLEVLFNTIENTSYLNEAYIQWVGTNFDKISIEVIPQLTTYEAGVDTNYQIVNGVIVPAAGDGVITPTNFQFVSTIFDELGSQAPGYWDATWNATTNEWEDISPVPAGTGLYNLFVADVVVYTLAKNALLLGDGFLRFGTAESALYIHNTRVKITCVTNAPDHEWKLAVIMALCRQQTQ